MENFTVKERFKSSFYLPDTYSQLKKKKKLKPVGCDILHNATGL